MSNFEERLRDYLLVKSIGPDTFESWSDDQWVPPFGRGIFGGTLIAQAMSAAADTVPENFHIHNISFTFLRSAKVKRMQFNVKRLRDGNSYISRTVEVVQDSNLLCFASISFQSTEEGQPQFFIMPPIESTADNAWRASRPGINGATVTTAVLSPEESLPAARRYDVGLKLIKSERRRADVIKWADEQENLLPIEQRYAVPKMYNDYGLPSANVRTAYWLRVRVPFNASPNAHRAALAWEIEYVIC